MAHFEKKLSVLNVEDSIGDSHLIHQELEKLNLPLNFKRITKKEEFIKALSEKSWDLVISDYVTHELTLEEALSITKLKFPDLVFVLVSKGIGEEGVADIMNAGVEDFVSKSRLERLIPVVRRIIREKENKDKEARALRAANEAHAAREQMLAIVSHDIKNPLSAIRLEAQMLLRVADRSGKSVLSEEVKIQASRILKTTDRLKSLISDLLDRNKSANGLSTLHRSNVRMTALIQEVVDTVRPHLLEKNIKLVTHCPNNSMELSIDRNKMFQVISNLLSNAIKFSPSAGAVTIHYEERENDLLFSVTDSGPGLKSDDLPKVFEKYWTGKITGRSGTGLGLFICKTIVEAHSGQITVENMGLGGARFTFYLPKPCAELGLRPLQAQAKSDARKKIYVIDDDEDLREVIGWALDKEGFSVHSYRDPKDALAKLEHPGQGPNLILADYHMYGMKGGEFLKLKNQIHSASQCPVIMISASPSEVEREVSKDLYQEIITKPLDLEGLVENMKKYLH